MGIINFNNLIQNETTIEDVIIPLLDGLMLIRKKAQRLNGKKGETYEYLYT
jgi:hypothetical protein